MLKRSAAVAASLAIVVGLSAIAVSPAAGATNTRKLALGVAMRDPSQESYDAFTASVGRPPAIWTMQKAWMGTTSEFPDLAFLRHLRQNGTTPMITWLPRDPQDRSNRYVISFRKILEGQFDPYIREWATAAKEFRGRLIIRFFHEMDGDWYPWDVCGESKSRQRQFRDAWKRIVRIYRKVGATNVRFLWSPISNNKKCLDLKPMYPGDKFVDYVGYTGLNWGIPSPDDEDRTWKTSWKPMVRVLAPGYAAVTRVAPTKPVIVAELASSSDAPKGTSKANWVRQGYPAAYRTYPRIKGIVYFNVDMLDHEPRHEDWPLTSPDNTPRREYRKLLREPRFQGYIR